MQTKEIRPGIFFTGVNDELVELFEGLWPVREEGVSYNSYVIKDEKNAVIDLAKDSSAQNLLSAIRKVIVPAKIDYVIINHMEPDHTGVLLEMRRINPNVILVGTEKTRSMLETFYGINENIKVVQDGEMLNLGQHTLQFHHTPNVHWPETMMTYEISSHILFSCDGFGGYGKLTDSCLFDDTCEDLSFYEQEALRYYANIVASFNKPVLTAIAKLAGLKIDIIAPSHGLMWRKNPERIISLYEKWSQFAHGDDQTGITLLVASMYHFTEKMAHAVKEGIMTTGIPLNEFNVTTTHISYILPSLMSFHGVVIAAPTYEGRLFPTMTQVLDMVALKRFTPKKALYVGSFGWGGGALHQINERLAEMKWEITDSFEFMGSPNQFGLDHGKEMGIQFANLLLGK